jgi:hypothetical protein
VSRAGEAIQPREVLSGSAAPSDEPDNVATFVDDDDGYLHWLQTHSAGYVVNSERHPTVRYLVLHKAGCSSINPGHANLKRERNWTVAYRKTCADHIEALTLWANSIGGRTTACGRCKPAQA